MKKRLRRRDSRRSSFSPDGRQVVRHKDRAIESRGRSADVRFYHELKAKFDEIGGYQEETCANPTNADFLMPGKKMCPYQFPTNPGGTFVEATTRVGPISYRMTAHVRGEQSADGKTWRPLTVTRIYAQRDGQAAVWSVAVQRL